MDEADLAAAVTEEQEAKNWLATDDAAEAGSLVGPLAPKAPDLAAAARQGDWAVSPSVGSPPTQEPVYGPEATRRLARPREVVSQLPRMTRRAGESRVTGGWLDLGRGTVRVEGGME